MSHDATVSSCLLQIVVWFLLAIALVASLLWLSTKIALGRSIWRRDTALIGASNFFCLFQTVAISLSLSNGLGQYAAGSPDPALKAQYASNLLYIITLALSKFAALAILHSIIPWYRTVLHNTSLGLLVLIVLYTLGSFFAAAFQCSASHPWLYTSASCIDRVSLWTAIECLNIFTELALVILPIAVTTTLKTCYFRRIGLSCIFLTRFAPIVASIVKIIYIQTDCTADNLTVATLTQFIQALSIAVVALSDPRIVIEIMHPSFLACRTHTARSNRHNHHHERIVIPIPAVAITAPSWPGLHKSSSHDMRTSTDRVHAANDSDSIASSDFDSVERKTRLAAFGDQLRRFSHGGTTSEICQVSPRSRRWPSMDDVINVERDVSVSREEKRLGLGMDCCSEEDDVERGRSLGEDPRLQKCKEICPWD